MFKKLFAIPLATWGVVQYQNGKFKKSSKYLNKAYLWSPDVISSSIYRGYLGLALYKLNQQENALFHLGAAMEYINNATSAQTYTKAIEKKLLKELLIEINDVLEDANISNSLSRQPDEIMHIVSQVENLDAQYTRIGAIVGEEENLNFHDSTDKYYNHLLKSLQLPCDVTGIEDFRWEERYVFGGDSSKTYRKLRETQPSYQDVFELLAINNGIYSQWMLYNGEDLAACVRRKSDGKEFYLGLAEIEAVNKKSENHELLYDYSVWFENNR